MRPSRASRLVAKVRRQGATPRCDAKVRRQLARARACVFSVFIVYCVCEIAARAPPAMHTTHTHTEILQGEHVLFGVVKCRCSEMEVGCATLFFIG